MASKTQHEVRPWRARLVQFVSATAALALSAGLGIAVAAAPAGAATAPEVSPTWLDYYFNNKGIGSNQAGDAPNMDGGWGFHRSSLIAGGQEVTHPGGVVFDDEVQHPTDASVKYRMGGAVAGPFTDNIEAQGQRIDTSIALGSASAQPATKVAFVWTAHNASSLAAQPFTLHYSDDTTSTVNLTPRDWCAAENSSNTAIAAPKPRYGSTSPGCTIFITNVINLAAGKSLDAIDLPDEPRVHIFAIASNADTQNAVSSFNANIELPETITVGDVITPSLQWVGEAPATTETFWYVDGVASEISTSSFVVPTSWAGKSLAYAAIGRTPGYAPSPQISNEVTVTPGELTAITEPTLAGLARVGDSLVVNTGQYETPAESPTHVGTSIEWLADDTPIPGAADQIFIPTETQVGKAISARVTVTKAGYTTLVFTTDATAAVLAADESPFPTDPVEPPVEPTLPDPLVAIRSIASVTGTAQVGKVVTARPGAFEPASARVTYQWLRGTAPIVGATSSSYRLTPADANTVISVRVIASAANRQTTEQFLAAGVVDNGVIATKKPRIAIKNKAVKKKKVRVGTTLRARSGKATAPGSKLKTKYRWFVGNKKIKGKKAGKAKFKVTKKLAGKRLHVRVTYDAKGYTKKTVKSAKTGKVVR